MSELNEQTLQENDPLNTMIRILANQIYDSLVSRDLVALPPPDSFNRSAPAKWTAAGRAMLNAYFPPVNVLIQPNPVDYCAGLAGQIIDVFGASAISYQVELDFDGQASSAGDLGTAVPDTDPAKGKAGLN